MQRTSHNWTYQIWTIKMKNNLKHKFVLNYSVLCIKWVRKHSLKWQSPFLFVLTFSFTKNFLHRFSFFHLLIIILFRHKNIFLLLSYHFSISYYNRNNFKHLIFIPFSNWTRAATSLSFRAVLLRILDFQLKVFPRW